jgi:hypothetical protein
VVFMLSGIILSGFYLSGMILSGFMSQCVGSAQAGRIAGLN